MILTAVLDVDMSSVPGECSLKYLGQTNGEVFGIDVNGKFNIENLKIVGLEVRERYRQVCCGKPVSDPLKIFIKQEPHKDKKIAEGRLRLIMSVSLIDSMVDRILFMRLAYKVVNNFKDTGIMLG